MAHSPALGRFAEIEIKSPVIIPSPQNHDVEKGIGRIPAGSKGAIKSNFVARWVQRTFHAASTNRGWSTTPVPLQPMRVRESEWIRGPWLHQALMQLSVEKCASGYPKLAAFVDSDPNFMIYRRFGYLRTRLLLYHQDVLREKERDLDEYDEETRADPTMERQLCSRARDDIQAHPKRKQLFEALDEDFRTYGSYPRSERA